MPMTIDQSQADMRSAYFGGATGVLVSGLVWLLAGAMALQYSNTASMLTLFVGGMFIFPLSIVLSKVLKRSGKHSSDNPLGKLALETTAILFIGLFIAFCVAQIKIEWFYPIMLLAIGVRYLAFQTLYGLKSYWVLGLALILSGGVCMMFKADFAIGPVIGGVIEILFSIVLFKQSSKPSIQTA